MTKERVLVSVKIVALAEEPDWNKGVWAPVTIVERMDIHTRHHLAGKLGEVGDKFCVEERRVR
jgi:hypothetical protein